MSDGGFLRGDPEGDCAIAGVAQLVELQPSKLNVASSSLVSRSSFFYTRVVLAAAAETAQSNQRVAINHRNLKMTPT